MKSAAIFTDIVKRVRAFKKSNPQSATYPQDLKELIAQALAEGISIKELSSETGISWGAIANWGKKYGLARYFETQNRKGKGNS